jgi:hypothetical protein
LPVAIDYDLIAQKTALVMEKRMGISRIHGMQVLSWSLLLPSRSLCLYIGSLLTLDTLAYTAESLETVSSLYDRVDELDCKINHVIEVCA